MVGELGGFDNGWVERDVKCLFEEVCLCFEEFSWSMDLLSLKMVKINIIVFIRINKKV